MPTIENIGAPSKANETHSYDERARDVHTQSRVVKVLPAFGLRKTGRPLSGFWRQDREPRPRCLFGRSADLRRLLRGELIEIRIAVTASFGDEVPLDRFGRIGRSAVADREQSGQAILSDWTAAQSGLAKQRSRLSLV